ncbi:MAG TPA: CHASE3 domain-containing protein [Polyangiaceae bacterium]
MPSDWTFGKRLVLGFALAAAILLVVAWSGWKSTETLIETRRMVAHTHEVRRHVAQLLASVVDAETGSRGYVITGQEAFLDPYRAAVAETDRVYRELKRLTADNPEQQRRLDAVRPVMDAKLEHARQTLELRRTQGAEGAFRLIAEGGGKRLMEELRRGMEEIDQTERTLLDRRVASAESAAAAAQTLMLWGSIGGALLVFVIGTVIARSLTAQIGAVVRRIQSSSAELQSVSNQQATGAREQATAMSEISTTITELLATSRQIAESAQRVAQIAEQTTASARAGDATVRRGSESVLGMRRQVDTIVSHMVDLGKKSHQIGSVLDIVSELAEQTNILAINATIEAAGAGEAGKRFSVVADEIRKLADRVGGSTKEIRTLIDDVRSAVNTTVMTTESGSKAVEAGALQFAEVASSFGEISSQVSTTTEAAKEIGLSTKQQTTAVEQVNQAIANVAQATRETEVSTGQVLQTASELTGMSRDLLRIVDPEAGRARAA